ncbi:unnamed protein product, partial [Symbiodinium sp. CCMP2592]
DLVQRMMAGNFSERPSVQQVLAHSWWREAGKKLQAAAPAEPALSAEQEQGWHPVRRGARLRQAPPDRNWSGQSYWNGLQD